MSRKDLASELADMFTEEPWDFGRYPGSKPTYLGDADAVAFVDRCTKAAETEIADYLSASLDVLDWRERFGHASVELLALFAHLDALVGDIRSGAYRKEPNE